MPYLYEGHGIAGAFCYIGFLTSVPSFLAGSVGNSVSQSSHSNTVFFDYFEVSLSTFWKKDLFLFCICLFLFLSAILLVKAYEHVVEHLPRATAQHQPCTKQQLTQECAGENTTQQVKIQELERVSTSTRFYTARCADACCVGGSFCCGGRNVSRMTGVLNPPKMSKFDSFVAIRLQ